MPQPLYFQRNRREVCILGQAIRVEFPMSYGIQPHDPSHVTVARRISLKEDLGWREVQNLQRVMKEADFWSSFPETGLHLITAEVKAGDEPQRIDLLYVRDDGGLIPCELKVGGTSLDTHGQLLRYLADLSNQTISREWVVAQRRHYLARKYQDDENAYQNIEIDLREFEERIASIPNNGFRLVNTGIILDEGFPQALISAVIFINQNSRLFLRLIQLDAFVADNWRPDADEYVMRLELNEIQCR